MCRDLRASRIQQARRPRRNQETSKSSRVIRESSDKVGGDKLYSALKGLSDRLMSISITYPNLHSILLLITEEYDDLFKIQKECNDKELAQVIKLNEDKINRTSLINRKLQDLKTKYETEISDFKKKLKEKNDEVFKKMKDYIINELDLDNYNITSDDFRGSDINGSRTRSTNKVKANDTKGHPLVPKLDLKEIICVRELANQLEAEDGVDSEYECDIDDEEGVQESSRKYFVDGSNVVTTNKRKQELEDRKKYIIHVFNQAYSESSNNSKDHN